MKYIPTFSEFLNEKNSVNEKRYKAPRKGFTKKEIEKILKKENDLSLFVNGKHYFIPAHMHNNGRLDDADNDTLFAVDQDGEEHELAFKDIELAE